MNKRACSVSIHPLLTEFGICHFASVAYTYKRTGSFIGYLKSMDQIKRAATCV